MISALLKKESPTNRRWRSDPRSGSIGFFLIIFISVILLTAMGLFAWVKKGTEQTVYTRFHSRAQFATTGGANLAATDLIGTTIKWNSALSSSYDVNTDSFTLVTITIDAVGIP